MIFRIPVAVTQTKTGYAARPLFFEKPAREDANLHRLLAKLGRDLVEQLETLGKEARHDELARWTFAPAVRAQRTSLKIELRRRIGDAKYLLVAFEHLGRRLAFATAVPEVWFEVARGEKLEERAAAVLTDHWRTVEREADDAEEVRPESLNLTGKAWVQTLDVAARTNLKLPRKPEHPFLFLGDTGTPDGAAELRSVGRCLDQLYPDELDRAALREREVVELVRRLDARDRRPVLLVGPRQCGKTAVVHAAVATRVAAKERKNLHKGNVWLLSPQRLVSGMSYVGQWEGRLLAILKHARKRGHVLYFDDLIGLFFAGQTSQSSLSAAMVLKPHLEQRTVRVLAEITPEQMRVLQERDRGFADLFHVLPVREPNDADTTRILIDCQRRLEGRHGCAFAPDALPAAVDLARRYDRNVAFPGKAATILTRLAVRAAANRVDYGGSIQLVRQRPTVNRDAVLADLAARSGLSLAFLDPKERLDRDEVRDKLAAMVVGQANAIEALADVVSVAKARLNDPDRPLASFLFLGPTGVGKTECAKATARVLFGDAERLLRVDLNEYNQPGSAARLVGTFAQPEGLLVAAVRRQPFSVILLDEIEKADRDVFDVLLQLLGEGRLTDALGRTADFTNTIVLMTSNLGVREAEGNLGFGSPSEKDGAYTRAAERFFRPEFFNRIDRVIPFRKLERAELARIARRLIDEVLAREGFASRQCALNVTPEAIERIVDAGYDPALGARAMKRAVERELTRPAAAKLAALSLNEFAVVTVRAETDRLAVTVGSPGFAPRAASPTGRSVEDRLDACHDTFDALADRLAAIRPHGPIGTRITAEQERYFAVKERLDAIVSRFDVIAERSDRERLAKIEGLSSLGLGRRPRYRIPTSPKNSNPDGRPAVNLLISAFGMEEAVEELFASAVPVEDDEELIELEQELALARQMVEAPTDDRPTYLWFRDFARANVANRIAAFVRLAWHCALGVDLASVDLGPDSLDAVLKVSGVHARALANTEAGTHLWLPKHGGPAPVRVDVVDAWPATLADPHAFGPILRVHAEGRPMVDVRTGLVMPPKFDEAIFRGFTLAAIAAGDL
jgi:ATP-dependent Clp protease ATP-binding subunit ClpC